MRVNGVTFVEDEVIKLSKKEFIQKHAGVFFLDRPEIERKKILSDVYDRIVSGVSDFKDGRRNSLP